MQLTSVDLPEPLGPISPTRSPRATARSMPSSATKPPKRLPRPCTSSSGAVITLPPRGRSNRPDDALGRQDDERDQQDPDQEHAELGRKGHGGPLLQRRPARIAPTSGPSQLVVPPIIGMAMELTAYSKAEGGARLHITEIIRERRAGHAHQGAGNRGGDQLQPQCRNAGRLGGQLVVADGGETVAELRAFDAARDRQREHRQCRASAGTGTGCRDRCTAISFGRST